MTYDEIKNRLKQLYPDQAKCEWDETTWRWEFCLRDPAEPDYDPGYVGIVPFKNGKAFPHGTLPEADHDQWAILFSLTGEGQPLFPIMGTVSEVKDTLDSLLGAPTPDIPQVPGLADFTNAGFGSDPEIWLTAARTLKQEADILLNPDGTLRRLGPNEFEALFDKHRRSASGLD